MRLIQLFFVPPIDKIASKKKIDAPMDIPLALMVANLSPHKGQETAIRAMNHLKKRGLKITLWVAGIERVGGKEFTGKLKTICQDLDVDKDVRFLGFRDDVKELLQAADFFLLPSKAEGLPLSILEAQATKVLTLASTLEGVKEIIQDRETGFIVPADDFEGYSNRIAEVIGNKPLYDQMVENAYAYVHKEHNFNTYFSRLDQAYQSI